MNTIEERFVAADEHWLSARAYSTPDALALVDDEGSITWSQLAALSRSMVAGLRARDIGDGDRVAVHCRPGRAFVALLHALQRVGAVAAALPLRATASELSFYAAFVDAALVVSDDPAATWTAGAPVAAASDLIASAAPGSAEVGAARIQSTATHSILFTSGTVGRPKGVMLTNAAHHASAVASCSRLALTGDDVWLAAMPLHHVGGLSILLRSAIAGFAVALRPAFEAADFHAAVGRHGATIASLVPTMLLRWLDHLDAIRRTGGDATVPAAFRCALIGGAGLGTALLQRACKAGIGVATTYGLTETASQVTTSSVMTQADCDGELVHSGRALDATHLEIADAGADGVGNIVVAGPQVMAGYYDDPRATAEVLRNGRLLTGDRGKMTADGNLQVLGRNDEIIITGGENVAPTEVEEILLAHPDVIDAGVYAIDDDQWGSAVMAKVVARAQSKVDEAALRAWCRAKLAGYKVPKHIGFVSSLPRTASGKLRRTQLDRITEAP